MNILCTLDPKLNNGIQRKKLDNQSGLNLAQLYKNFGQ